MRSHVEPLIGDHQDPSRFYNVIAGPARDDQPMGDLITRRVKRLSPEGTASSGSPASPDGV